MSSTTTEIRVCLVLASVEVDGPSRGCHISVFQGHWPVWAGVDDPYVGFMDAGLNQRINKSKEP